MDITKYNFEEEFDRIKEVIEESTFLAIDGEFTGLRCESVDRICNFDTPGERYRKIIDGASDFLLIQFGLCAFKANKAEKRYEARPYNFYIFPRPQNHQSPDRRFLCQSSSIDFLISHNFDFNKLFKEGIPYLSHNQELKVRADLEQKLADRNNSSFNVFRSPDGTPAKKAPCVIPQEQKEFIADIREKLDAYLQSEETEPLAFPPCNNFQRKLVYQSVEQDYPLVRVETKTGEKKERFLVMTKCIDQKDAEEKEEKRQAMERMKVDIQVGFSKVMKLITDSGKLVVGHNMYLDVIHSVNHFYGPVPQELEDFKEMISTIFPRLLDTKLMATTSPLKEYFMGTSVEELRYATSHPPFKQAQMELAEGFTKYSDGGDIFHEAGYDAFVTGSCFASMINFLGRYQKPASNFLLPTDHGVQPFINKLFMYRVADIPYVNLAGPDIEPSRDNVFHVTFPEEWRTSDLHQLFEPYGNVQISWLTSTTAYVGLMKKENAKLATSGLCQAVGKVRVVSYTSHRHMMQATSHSTTTTTTVPTPSAHPKPIAAGVKRKSPPTDIAHPPAKLHRKSLTEEIIPCPSIPEEEKGKEIEEDEKEEKNEEIEEEEEDDEDLGVPVTNLETTKKVKEGDEMDTGTQVGHVVSSNGDKLFDEPDAW